MQEILVSLAEAANILGIGQRQMRKLVERGVIKPHPTESKSTIKKRLFRMTDVASVREIWDKGVNPEAAFVEARQAAMEVRVLRRELEMIRQVIGIDHPIIGTDRDTVVGLLLEAEDLLREPPSKDSALLLTWARRLHAMTEGHYESITFHTDQKQPWRAFLNLGRHLLKGYDPLVTRYDINLHTIYQLLGAGLRHARMAAYMHVRAVYGKMYAAKIFPEVKGCPHEEVIALSFNGISNEISALIS
jgi:hypothetical protein